jgi:hypothetical protein
MKNSNSNLNVPTFYLKTNGGDNFQIKCLLHWIDIVEEYGADYYILVDNADLRERIRLYYVENGKAEPKFLESDRKTFNKVFVTPYKFTKGRLRRNMMRLTIKLLRSKFLSKLCGSWRISELIKKKLDAEMEEILRHPGFADSPIIAGRWINIGAALFTPFVHAKLNNIEYFWNIDADDTMLMANPEQCEKILKEAETFAKKNSIDIFSLDFWYTQRIQWTFGISFVKNHFDAIKICLQASKLTDKLRSYQIAPHVYYQQIDGFFGFLRYAGLLNIETFYVENLYFEHYLNWSNYWQNNRKYSLVLYKPHFISEFNDGDGVTIPYDVVRLNVGLTKETSNYEWRADYAKNMEKNQNNLLTDISRPMRIAILAHSDGEAWSLLPICREMLSRGHLLDLYLPRDAVAQRRILSELKIPTYDLGLLSGTRLNRYDCTLGGQNAAKLVIDKDIYTFSFDLETAKYCSNIAEFVFRPVDRKPIFCLDYAEMTTGRPFDEITIDEEIVEKKQILYIDSGHIPYGLEGKSQIADMLLRIAHENPDYEIIVKPRWLRNQGGSKFHYNAIHLYDIIEERSNNELPDNLILLEEHLPMRTLIKQSHSVITLFTTSVLDILAERKGLCIVTGYSMEDRYDKRIENYKNEEAFFKDTGCLVNITDVPKFMPHGISYDESVVNKYTPESFGASSRIVNVIEYVVGNFLCHKRYPESLKYNYNSYKSEMKVSMLTWCELKQKRLKNYLYGIIINHETEYITTAIDYSPLKQFADTEFEKYSVTKTGQRDLLSSFEEVKSQFYIHNAVLLSSNDIEQSFLLEALYYLGQYDEILSMNSEEVLCIGPYHYYCALINHERGNVDAVVYHCGLFLLDYCSRAYGKYLIEEPNRAVKRAYELFFSKCDGVNIAPDIITQILASYYVRNVEQVNPDFLRRAKSVIVCSLLQSEEEKYSVKSITTEERKMRIEFYRYELDKWFVKPQSDKVMSYYARFNACMKDHGVWYTVCLGFEKIYKRVKAKAGNSAIAVPLHLRNIYQNKVMACFSTYAKTLRNHGLETEIYLSTPAIGDLYYLLADYMKPDESKAINYWVFGKGGRTVAELYGIRDAVVLTKDEIINIGMVLSFVTGSGMHIAKWHLFMNSVHTNIVKLLLGNRIPNVIRFYSKFKDDKTGSSVCTHFKSHDIQDYFKKNNLVPKNTIILAPYAKSVKALPVRFWEKLAQELNHLGYVVATNVNENNPAENPIQGMVAFSVPLDEIVPAVELAGCIIGLRSGLMDVIESANACKISVMHKDSTIDYGAGRISMCDLWKLSESYDSPNIYDVIYSDRGRVACVKEICTLVNNYFNTERNGAK